MGRLHCRCKLPNANPARACQMSHFRLAPDKGPTCWVVSVSCHGNLCILVCLCKVRLLVDISPKHLLMCTCHIFFFFFSFLLLFYGYIPASIDANWLWTMSYRTKPEIYYVKTLDSFCASNQSTFQPSTWIHNPLCGWWSKDEIAT